MLTGPVLTGLIRGHYTSGRTFQNVDISKHEQNLKWVELRSTSEPYKTRQVYNLFQESVEQLHWVLAFSDIVISQPLLSANITFLLHLAL